MKNFEKYADRFSLVIASGGIKNEYYDKYLSDLPIGFMSVKKLEEWLLAEEPIKLTHAEKVILENLNDVTSIGRDEGGRLFIMRKNWTLAWDFNYFENLFQFVKDEPLEIKWLLENCEVIEE